MLEESLYQKLCNDFPRLYRAKPPCDIRSGWFDLVYVLSSKLEKLIDFVPESDPSTLFFDKEDYHAVQIKEKFGGLRFYMCASTEEMWNLIEEASAQSIKTCEICGAPGEPCGNRWIETLCPAHSRSSAV